MNSNLHALLLILLMGAIIFGLRCMPFIIFSGRKTPKVIAYTGKYLPFAIMGMLLVYCLKDTHIISAPYGIPEIIALAVTAGLQIWKKKSLLSIIAGTLTYMLLMQLIF